MSSPTENNDLENNQTESNESDQDFARQYFSPPFQSELNDFFDVLPLDIDESIQEQLNTFEVPFHQLVHDGLSDHVVELLDLSVQHEIEALFDLLDLPLSRTPENWRSSSPLTRAEIESISLLHIGSNEPGMNLYHPPTSSMHVSSASSEPGAEVLHGPLSDVYERLSRDSSESPPLSYTTSETPPNVTIRRVCRCAGCSTDLPNVVGRHFAVPPQMAQDTEDIVCLDSARGRVTRCI